MNILKQVFYFSYAALLLWVAYSYVQKYKSEAEVSKEVIKTLEDYREDERLAARSTTSSLQKYVENIQKIDSAYNSSLDRLRKRDKAALPESSRKTEADDTKRNNDACPATRVFSEQDSTARDELEAILQAKEAEVIASRLNTLQEIVKNSECFVIVD